LVVGQVGAGVGLAVALAPALGAVEDARQETPAELRRAVGDEGGAEQVLAHVVDPTGRLGPGVLLGPDDLLGDGGVAASVLGGPAEADPAGLAEHLLPTLTDLEADLLVAGAATALQRRELAHHVLGEPRLRVGAELLVGDARDVVGKAHRVLTYRGSGTGAAVF
jgi:hypothetical protein